MAVEQREADEERRVGALLVDAACESSCCEIDVPQRGHHSVERWPRYSQPRSWTSFRKRQMYSMFVSEKVK